MAAIRAAPAATLVAIALGSCSFGDEGLGSATSLGATTSTQGSTSSPSETGSEASADGDATSSQGSAGSSSSESTSGAITTGPGSTDSSGGGSSGSGSTGPVPVCGNGVVEPPEPCDGGDVLVQCGQIDPSTMGEPDCNADCTLDLQPCCDIAGTSCPAVADDCCGECVLENFQLVCQ